MWAWPQYARVAAQFLPKPIALFSNVNPEYPGLVGMLAAAGRLDQAGVSSSKTFGDLEDGATLARLRPHLLAAGAANRRRGQTYAHIGGRSLGIETAVADPALWMETFGLDVDHIDQMELVCRAEADERLAASVQSNWPHAYSRLACPPEALVEGFHCNHIHGSTGDRIEEPRLWCPSREVRFDLLDS